MNTISETDVLKDRVIELMAGSWSSGIMCHDCPILEPCQDAGNVECSDFIIDHFTKLAKEENYD